MKKYSIVILGLLFSGSLIAQNNHTTVIKTIDKLLKKELKKDKVNNVFLSIYSPAKNFEWHAAKGKFKDGREVSIQNPFYTASVGKTFTATAIGILVDEGKVQFEDPIAKYLPHNILNELHVFDEVDYSERINISHLLQHTSGLADYFGEPIDNSATMLESMMSETDKFWKPEDIITYYKSNFKPLFAPGDGYNYTDTEYVLLGMIIEEVSGKSFHEFITDHIIIPLELNHTYLNLRSEPILPTLTMAEIYSGELELSSFKSLSADWAGGAIVSTGKDLINFHQALREGKLVTTETYKAMQEWVPEEKGMSYGYGLRKINFKELFFTLPKWEVIGHSGLNGTSMYYCPDLDVYLASTLNQLEASKASVIFMVKVLMELNKL
jgi:CubicO group peptidase (beta-lactamase class C family)